MPEHAITHQPGELVSARTVSAGGFQVALTPPPGNAAPAVRLGDPRRRPRVVADRTALEGLIVGNQEISARAGVSKALVHAWASASNRGFPAPVVVLAAGPLYWWPQVAEWLTGQAQAPRADRRYIPAPDIPAPAVQAEDWAVRPVYLPLVGVAEIGSRAGVGNAAVCNWRRRYAVREPQFPACVADLALGQIYWWPHVQRWLAAAGKPGTLAGAV